MAYKNLRISDETIPDFNKYWYRGNLSSTGKVTLFDFASADAVFKRKKPHPLDVTPFYVKEVVDNKTPFHRENGSHRYEGTLAYVFGSTVVESTVTEIPGLFMLNKARHKISGANQDLGESLVELDQTIKMIRKNLDRIDKIGSALKNGEWSKLDSLIKGKTPDSVKNMKPSKRLSSGYLEISFGWMPLLSSVHTAVNAYGKGILTRGSKVSAVSGNKRLDLSKGNLDTSAVGRASISGKVKNPNVATLNSLGLVNPALMAWQRVPYSFVVDWFVPIGPILGSLTAEAGLEGILQSYTDIVLTERGNRHGWTRRQAEYWRKPYSGIPIGNPFGRSAQLSIGKLISAVALVRQRFP